MKYAHILRYVAETPWAILPAKMDEILAVLARRAAGDELTAEEIAARLGDAPRAPAPRTAGSVAVIPIHGTIAHRMGSMDESSGGISAERIGRLMSQALADESVGSIVLDVNSPGGTVAGMPELAAQLLAARGQKPIVAVANALMASAAYWIAAAAADEIVASPSALVGSIGVYLVRQDLSKALAQQGIAVDIIKAGTYKADDLPFTPLTDEGRAHLQGLVDAMYDSFVSAVAQGRGVTPAAVREGYGEGRALLAKDAKTAGLVDRVETLEATITRLASGRWRPKATGARAELDEQSHVEAAETHDLALAEWAMRLR